MADDDEKNWKMEFSFLTPEQQARMKLSQIELYEAGVRLRDIILSSDSQDIDAFNYLLDLCGTEQGRGYVAGLLAAVDDLKHGVSFLDGKTEEERDIEFQQRLGDLGE